MEIHKVIPNEVARVLSREVPELCTLQRNLNRNSTNSIYQHTTCPVNTFTTLDQYLVI